MPTTPDEWRHEWIAAWAAIGWLASTDLLQGHLIIAVTNVARNATTAVQKLEAELANCRVSLDWTMKASKRR